MTQDTADADFRRLAARGTLYIYPATAYVPAGTEVIAGLVHEVSVPRPVVRLVWWPTGQGPGYGKGSQGNPFCQRSWDGATVGEVLTKAVEATRPRECSLESLVSHMLYERGRKRAEAARCPT